MIIKKINENDILFRSIDAFDLGGWIPGYLMSWLISLGITKNMDDLYASFKRTLEYDIKTDAEVKELMKKWIV